MKKRYFLWLLVALMVFSPVAVFADNNEAVTVDPYDACTWTDSSMSQARDANGNLVKGLFKAKRANGGIGLYYADSNGKVVKTGKKITVSDGWRFLYSSNNGETFWNNVSGGTYSYLIRNHDGDFYIENLPGVYTVKGTAYYVKKNGTVRTNAGFVDYDGNRYYVKKNGTVKNEAGWIKYKGKRYRAGAKGIVHTKVGAFTLNGRRYVCQADGTICTKKGPVKANGRLYYVKNKYGVLGGYYSYKLNGKTYHVNKKGVIKVGRHKWKNGKYYYSTKKGYLKSDGGMVTDENGRFCVQAGGKVIVDQMFNRNGYTYVAEKDGTLKKGLFTWQGVLYYANDKCALKPKAGIVTIGNDSYYVAAGGRVYVNQRFWAGGYNYIADANGHLLNDDKVWWKGRYYIIDNQFKVITKKGIIFYKQKYYYNKSGGGLVRNSTYTVNGKHYYAGNDAAFVTFPNTFTYYNSNTKENVTVHPASDGTISSEEWKLMKQKKKKENTDEQDINVEG